MRKVIAPTTPLPKSQAGACVIPATAASSLELSSAEEPGQERLLLQKGALITTSLLPGKKVLLPSGEEVPALVCGHPRGLSCDFHTARQLVLFSLPDVLSVASRLSPGTFKTRGSTRNALIAGNRGAPRRGGCRLCGVRCGGRG